METNTGVKDYLRVIFRHKAVIIVSVVVLMSVILLSMELDTPTYSAAVKMLQSANWKSDEEYYRKLYTRTTSEVEWVRSPHVIRRVVKALNLDKRPIDYEKGYASGLKKILIEHRIRKFRQEFEQMPPEQKQDMLFGEAIGELIGKISVDASIESTVFTINVTDFNPAMATKIANSLSRSYVLFDLEKQIEETRIQFGDRYAKVIQLENYIDKLKDTLDGRPIPDLEAIGPASVKIVAQAQGAQLVKVQNKGLRLVIGFFVSIVLGVAIAFGIEYVNQSFISPGDIERFLKIPCLGSIPKIKSKKKLLITESNPVNMDYFRSFQILSNEIRLLMRDKKFKTLLITHTDSSGETEAIIANIGIYLAQKAGYRVLLIDADMRTPNLTGIFHASNEYGLAKILEDGIEFESAIINIDVNLDLLPAGEAISSPMVLFDSSSISDVFKKSSDLYDIVLVNCANLREFTDSAILASHTDGAALVINEGKISRYVVEKMISPLKQKNLNIVGAIFNNRTYVIPKVIYKLT